MGGVPGVLGTSLGNCHLIQTQPGVSPLNCFTQSCNFTPRPGLYYSHTRIQSDSRPARCVSTKYQTSRNTRWSRRVQAPRK